MKTFIQTRDNIGFAVLHTGGEPDHSVTPDHTTAIDITGHEDPESLIRKKYDPATKTWGDAPIHRLAEINQFGDIIEIRQTVYTHEIDSNTIVMPDEVDFRYKYINGQWVAPVIDLPVEPAPLIIPSLEEINAPSQEDNVSEETSGA
jgi:hypothetical protein